MIESGNNYAIRSSIEEAEAELKKEKYKRSHHGTLQRTIVTLLIVVAIAVTIAAVVMPVLQVSGTSMSQTLNDGDIVLTVNTKSFRTGDVIAFYYNNTILIKRVIASPGDWVNIDKSGNVFVNGEMLDEPYVEEKALGECNITMPYQVPDGKYFVMGDHRETSIDSRNKTIGCVGSDIVAGRILFRVWPLEKIGIVH